MDQPKQNKGGTYFNPYKVNQTALSVLLEVARAKFKQWTSWTDRWFDTIEKHK